MQGTAGTRWQGSSAESLSAISDELTTVIDGGADGASVGASLFFAADVLRRQTALRRAMTDPTVQSAAKVALVRELFASHLEPAATDLVAAASARRWAAAGDLPDALARLAVISVVKAADVAGDGDRLEQGLFGFSRVVADNPGLRDALSDPARSVTDKQGLVRSLLDGKVDPGVMELAQRSVTDTHLTAAAALQDFIEITSETRGRLVATVRAARPLSDSDNERLTSALTGQYGKQVHVNLIVDPSVIGGLRVAIGHEVIDGTVASRLDEARRQLAG